MNLINATHFNTHIYSDNPLFKPFCYLIYILCFTDLARKEISVFWCTFLKCKTRKRLNWIFLKKRRRRKANQIPKCSFLVVFFFFYIFRFAFILFSLMSFANL